MDKPTFQPAKGLANPHVQTLWPVLFRHLPPLPSRRERFETPDGDFVDMDWLGPERGPLVLLLHGLTGSARSGYILGLQDVLATRGWLTAALNFRGCSGAPNRTARCYHSGDTADVKHLYAALRRRYPGRSIAAVGFSLGGNVLLKWLGEEQPALATAVAVSVPFLLNRCADHMDRGWSRCYRNRLLSDLRRYLAAKIAFLDSSGNRRESAKLRALGDVSAVRSFWEFDGRVIAPLYGFRDAADYYTRSSCRQFLKDVRAPTLIVHAEDDPFVPPDAIPTPEEISADVALEISRHGGHVGFVTAQTGGSTRYWLDDRIAAHLGEVMGDPLDGAARRD